MTNWTETIKLGDVFYNDDITFIGKRDVIVGRIKNSKWFKRQHEFDTLPELVEELSDTESVEDFDEVWSAIYDEADADKVWISLDS